MTPERKHELNKLLAEVANEIVEEIDVPIDGKVLILPSGVRWEPIEDANDSMVVEEMLRDKNILIEYYSCTNKTLGWHVHLYPCDTSLEYAFRDPSRLVAFALSVEQWWKERPS